MARQLKYNSGGMDLDRLQAELGSSTDQQDEDHEDAYADPADRYADYADEEDEDQDASA